MLGQDLQEIETHKYLKRSGEMQSKEISKNAYKNHKIYKDYKTIIDVLIYLQEKLQEYSSR